MRDQVVAGNVIGVKEICYGQAKHGLGTEIAAVNYGGNGATCW